MERLTLAARAADIGVWHGEIPKNELVWDDQISSLYGGMKEGFGGAYDMIRLLADSSTPY